MGQIAVRTSLNIPPSVEARLPSGKWLGILTGVLLTLAALIRSPVSGQHAIAPGPGETAPFTRGPFDENGFVADASALPAGIVARGSYIGGDSFRGTFITGWFGRSSHIAMMVAGYPNGPGNALELEIRLGSGSLRRLAYTGSNPGERWKPWVVTLPADALGFRIIAIDGTTTFRGWLAVSQPYRANWQLTLLSQAAQSILAFVTQGALFAALMLGLADFVSRRFDLPPWLVPIGAATSAALLGYVAFWLYFACPAAGRIYSWFIFTSGTVKLLVLRQAARPDDSTVDWWGPMFLAAVVGAGAVAVTCLFDGGSFSYLAANRFISSLPVDNRIPEIFADRLWSGHSPRHLLGDWLSSDRPPLQTGWLLLTRPIAAALGFDDDTSAGTGGVCFQLLWVPALWALLRRMGARPNQAAAVIAALSFSGFFLLFTVFTWPKLGAAALLLGAFLAGWGRSAYSPASDRSRLVFAGICAGLGWVAHGGVAFSLIALLPLIVATGLRHGRNLRDWRAALLGFVIIALPWFCYQKFYDPPGDRLLKWHLAGVIPVDERSFSAALFDSYRSLGWRGALANRWINLRLQWAGNWRALGSLSPPKSLVTNRWEQVAYSAYGFGWWLPGLIILPWALWRERKSADPIFGWTAAWWLTGWLVWLGLMFIPNAAIIHQGTPLTQLLGFALMAWSALRINRVVFLACAGLQILLFLTSWLPASSTVSGAVSPLALGVSVASAVVLAQLLIAGSSPGTPSGR